MGRTLLFLFGPLALGGALWLLSERPFPLPLQVMLRVAAAFWLLVGALWLLFVLSI